MKKILLMTVLLLTVSVGFSQKNVRQTASNFLKEGKLDKALEAINQCILDPSTATDAKSWMIRGNIYLEIAFSTDEKYRSLEPNALAKAYESYSKSNEYDTKKEYTDDIFQRLKNVHDMFFDQAAEYFNKKEYREAMTLFEKSADAYTAINVPDTLAVFYASTSATLAKDTAKAKQFFESLVQNDIRSAFVYEELSGIYKNEKDSAKALACVRKGLQKNPNNLRLIVAETNIYLAFNDEAKAIDNLTLVSNKDTTNYLVFNALGTQYDRIWNDTLKNINSRNDAFKLAVQSYEKAIRLKPDYYDPYINLAALYFNLAVPISINAQNLPLDKTEEYDKLTKEANQYYAKAVPYLEKAVELDPSNLQSLMSLKQAYSSLGDKEKVKSVTEKINLLKQQN